MATNARPGLSRRRMLQGLATFAGALGAGLVGVRPALAQEAGLTASGAGVNVKMMPSADGSGMVPMRESFAFDPSYAQCIVEDNPEAFAMDTFGMGRVVVQPHSFFMAMMTTDIRIAGITANPDGTRTATLVGKLN